MEKQNRKRDIQLIFRVTPEEKELIQEKMHLDGITNFREDARQMATKGYIVNTDPSTIKNLAAKLQKITVNIKQILLHADAMGKLHTSDTEEMRQKLNECWNMQRQLFKEAMRLK